MMPAVAAMAAKPIDTLRKWRRSQLASERIRLSSPGLRSRRARSSSLRVRLMPMAVPLRLAAGESAGLAPLRAEVLEAVEIVAREGLQQLDEIGLFLGAQQ